MKRPSQAVIEQANAITQYETQEKGVFGGFFGWEARDGFVAKVVKAGATLGSGALGSLLVSSWTGGMVFPLAFALSTMGFAAGALIGREAEKKVLSDMHDSTNNTIGKFAHWFFAAVITPVLILSGLDAMGAGQALQYASGISLEPFAAVTGSILLKAAFGNPELKQQAAEARALAGRAMQNGMSPDMLVGMGQQHERPAQPSYRNTVTPEETRQMNAKMAEHSGGQVAKLQEQIAALSAEQQART